MEFKRINFFKGFFTHAEDWQQAEAYQIAKHQLHNKCLHGWGVVSGYLENMDVEVPTEGMTLVVRPGLAVDGQGRELHLDAPVSVPFEPGEFAADTDVYLVVRYNEELIDRRENVANPEYSGHAFVRELAVPELTPHDPSNGDAVELARIHLDKQTTRVLMPANPAFPGANEVDLRYRRLAGVASGQWRIREMTRSAAAGEISVPANDTARIRIEEVKLEEHSFGEVHRFYVASCYPLGEAEINWRMNSRQDREGNIEYLLYVRNYAEKKVNVRFQVYQL